MHILAFILYFVCGSINAACHQDYSGIKVIAEVIGIFILLVIFAYCPWLLIIGGVVIGLIAIVCNS